MKGILYLCVISFWLTSTCLYAQMGADCNTPFAIPALPYSEAFSTCGMGNAVTNINSPCAPTLTGNDGEDMIFALTPTLSGCYRILATGTSSSLLVTDNCPTDVDANCIVAVPSVLGFMQTDLSLDMDSTYYITIATGATDSCGDFNLDVGLVPSLVSNDVCTSAQPLQGTGSNYDATACGEPNQWSPDPDGVVCFPNNGSVWSSMENGVWYTFSNPMQQDVDITVYNIECVGAGGDLQIGVWTNSGTCDLGIETFIACAIGTGTITLSMNDLPSGDYYLFLDGDGGSQCSWYLESNIIEPPVCESCDGGTPPDNDNCATPENLGSLPAPEECMLGSMGVNYGTPITITGTNVCATPSDPYPSGGSGCDGGTQANPSGDVWYSFTATATQLISLLQSTGFSLTTPNIALYETSCPTDEPLACSVGIGGAASLNYLGLVPGNTYYLQISGEDVEDQCEFSLIIRNDNDCRTCITSSYMSSVVPEPVEGIFPLGQTVEFCYTVDEYTSINNNQLHGIVPVFGAGWDTSTLSPAGAAPMTCGLVGEWIWYNYPDIGWGWWHDKGLLILPPDGDPSNNTGDANILGVCEWTFCWEITALPDCDGEQDLSIVVENYADGETGSGTDMGCEMDANFEYAAALECESCTPPIISVLNIVEPCEGEMMGEIELEVDGTDLIYNWNGPIPIGDVQNPNGLPAGTYGITVTDVDGCFSTESIIVNENDLPLITLDFVQDVSCFQANDGLIDISISGGQMPYDIDWDNDGIGDNDDDEDISELSVGTYSVTVSDANGCSSSLSIDIVEPDDFSVVISGDASICSGQNTVLDAGSFAGYIWSNGNTSQTITVSPTIETEYCVTVTNAAGCLASTCQTVTVNANPTADFSIDLGCPGDPTQFTHTGIGDIAQFDWTFADVGASNEQNPAQAFEIGDYEISLAVTDVNGCEAQSGQSISIASCCASDAGQAAVADDAPDVLCTGESAIVGASNFFLEDDDALGYALHNSPDGDVDMPGFVLYALNADGVFVNDGSVPYNTPLYVSSVAADDNGSGLPDLASDCISVSAGVEVVFLEPANLIINEFCDWSVGDFVVTVRPVGGLPAWDNGESYSISGDYAGDVPFGENFLIVIPEDGTNVYGFSSVDALGCDYGFTSEEFVCIKTPIELLRFTGTAQSDGNLLKWVTATESENDYFTLLRSTNGEEFKAIATVDGAGNSLSELSYAHLDVNPPAGIAYYQLQQTDFNGNSTFSEVIRVSRHEEQSGIVQLFPIPAKDAITITHASSETQSININVYDLAGKLLINANENVLNGVNSIDLDISQLSAGVYFLSIENGGERSISKFVVK